jgi:hypothetical protein
MLARIWFRCASMIAASSFASFFTTRSQLFRHFGCQPRVLLNMGQQFGYIPSRMIAEAPGGDDYAHSS